MKKTIIVVHDQGYVSGGAAKIAIQEAIALRKSGYNVIYFTALGPVDSGLINNDVSVVCIGGEHIGNTKKVSAMMRGLWNKRAEKELKKLLIDNSNNEVIVHIHGWTKVLSSSIFDACYQCHIQPFVTLHDYFIICQNGGLYNYQECRICNCIPGSFECYLKNCDKRNYFQKIYRNIRQYKTRNVIEKCNPKYIYISAYSKRIFESFIQGKNNGYLVENYVEVGENVKVDVSYNEFYIFIGRLSDEKNPEMFCKAITECGVKGIVIGDGPKFNKLKEMYKEIEFVGWISSDDMQPYLNKARCLVTTNMLYETMGLTIIEMQAKGIPCIVPEHFAGSEYIQDKVSGLYYNINNFESLIEAIIKTKDDSYVKSLGDAFYNSYDKGRFSIDTYIEKLKLLFGKE